MENGKQNTLRLEQFDYDLPQELIAQVPCEPRDRCKLIYVEKNTSNFSHCAFTDLVSLLRKGDRLVFNNTKVLPARIYGVKDNGITIEFLFTEKIDDFTWVALVGPARRLKIGASVAVKNCDGFRLQIVDVLPNGDRVVKLLGDGSRTLEAIMEQVGHLPLPHYIERDDEQMDREAYQTVFAQKKGAVASPTAGLHFTDELIAKLTNSGVDTSFLTLHVGIGTFRPVKESDPSKHPMHEEYYELSQQTVEEINSTKRNGGRIIAVGTTVVRVLEHCSIESGMLTPSTGKTKLMILPPFEFKTVDGLITNFHLPKSTLLMLVCAFAGIPTILAAYNEAIQKRYRFFSYGDAMLIM